MTIWEFTGAIFVTAGAVLALTIATTCLYIIAVAIQSSIEKRRKRNKRIKRNSNKEKKGDK